MRSLLLCCCCIAACRAPVPAPWPRDAAPALAAAAASGRDTVVCFALPGRELSDQMERRTLDDPVVLAALERGGFLSLRLDGFAQQRLRTGWLGQGEGMGVCVLDPAARVYAARPGPQAAAELAAWLDLVAARRPAVVAARQAQASAPRDPAACHRLGSLLLELGCRRDTEELLLTAAQGGIADARLQLARRCAQDGQLERARQWLRGVPPSPGAAVTEGCVLFEERRHQEAVQVLRAALQRGGLGDDRECAQLFLGKALHETGSDRDAVAVLEALLAEGSTAPVAAAAARTLDHIRNPEPGHTHF